MRGGHIITYLLATARPAGGVVIRLKWLLVFQVATGALPTKRLFAACMLLSATVTPVPTPQVVPDYALTPY